MTKSKSRLRAEAVERLKNYEARKHKNLAQCVLGDRYEDVSFEANRLMLIDLLTDDAHEARSSYEERLDVPVSDCPYCGCKRVVIHDFSDIYEEPHSYRVEHLDEKEAFNAGCFESYYSFDSAEKAVEHANMRNPLIDKERGTDVGESAQDGEGDKSYRLEKLKTSDEKLKAADKVLSLLTGNERVFADDEPDDEERGAREKPDAQSRAEIEDAERSAKAAETEQGCVDDEIVYGFQFCDAPSSTMLGETVFDSDGEPVGWIVANGADSKKLKRRIDVLEANNMQLHALVAELQAERDEFSSKLKHEMELNRDNRNAFDLERIDELQAKVDELNEQLESAHAKSRSLKAHIAKMQEGRHGWHVKYPELEKKNAELEARVDGLIAERDMYRDKLGRAIDAAHGIARMADE